MMSNDTPNNGMAPSQGQRLGPGRITGYDMARSLAIISMIYVNYRYALGHPEIQAGHWFLTLTELFPCREAAMFVMLAGIGSSLSAWKRDGEGGMVPNPAARPRLIIRAFVIMGIGLLNSAFWGADILRFFAIYMFAGALFLYASKRMLAVAALACTFAFPLLLLFMDYDSGWNFTTVDYDYYRSVAGFFQGLIFNGHHSFLPWMAFYLVGMFLGRLDLSANRRIRRNVMVAGAGMALSSELVSLILTLSLDPYVSPQALEIMHAMVGREPYPPMPLFVFQAGGTAIFAIVACLEVAARYEKAMWQVPLVCLGQLSLTIYVAHAWVGLGVLLPFGKLENSTPTFSVMAATGFIILALITSTMWRRYIGQGPLEWVLRRAAR